MTRFEEMKDEKKLREIAKHICDVITEKADCDVCPFANRCYPGHTGSFYFLKEEVIN